MIELVIAFLLGAAYASAMWERGIRAYRGPGGPPVRMTPDNMINPRPTSVRP